MDSDLVKRAQRGDEDAFVALVTAVGDRMHAIALRILRDVDLADDAAQQALLGIWRDLPKLRDPSRFDGWAYRLLVRCCYAEGHRQRRWAPNLRILSTDHPTEPDSEDAVANRDQLEHGFRRLSLEHRAVIVLHYYADLPLDRVAEILDIPPGTARSRLHHAMRGLRAALDADARTSAREATP